jgi:hypothetical protein
MYHLVQPHSPVSLFHIVNFCVHVLLNRIYRSSFLLLTMGGMDALEQLVRTNRYIKF